MVCIHIYLRNQVIMPPHPPPTRRFEIEEILQVAINMLDVCQVVNSRSRKRTLPVTHPPKIHYQSRVLFRVS